MSAALGRRLEVSFLSCYLILTSQTSYCTEATKTLLPEFYFVLLINAFYNLLLCTHMQ